MEVQAVLALFLFHVHIPIVYCAKTNRVPFRMANVIRMHDCIRRYKLLLK